LGAVPVRGSPGVSNNDLTRETQVPFELFMAALTRGERRCNIVWGGVMEPWEKLVILVERCVPAGTVTTYGDLAEYFFGRRDTQAIGAMLGAWLKRDHDAPTHRVVHDDGTMSRPANLPDQGERLMGEGVPIDSSGRVNLSRCRRAVLA
jgi:alkylated DNA nucleotide flippase Atl1